MTDWKMPEKIKHIKPWQQIIERTLRNTVQKIVEQNEQVPGGTVEGAELDAIMQYTEDLLEKHLLLTFAERDEREQKIKNLETEVERLGGGIG